MSDSPIYNCEINTEIKLYQAGQYRVVWYSDANTIKGLNSDTIWDHIQATARFELSESSQNATVSLSNVSSNISITGTYNWMHKPASEVHLHFFQETDIQGYWNNIFSYKTTGEEAKTLPLKLNIDSNKNLYIYLDLAGDAKLTEVNQEYMQAMTTTAPNRRE